MHPPSMGASVAQTTTPSSSMGVGVVTLGLLSFPSSIRREGCIYSSHAPSTERQDKTSDNGTDYTQMIPWQGYTPFSSRFSITYPTELPCWAIPPFIPEFSFVELSLGEAGKLYIHPSRLTELGKPNNPKVTTPTPMELKGYQSGYSVLV